MSSREEPDNDKKKNKEKDISSKKTKKNDEKPPKKPKKKDYHSEEDQKNDSKLDEKKKEKTSEEKKEKSAKLDNNKKSKEKERILTKYDIVLAIDSLINISQHGWNVTFQNYNETEEKFEIEQIVVGMLGRENVGKTYIINKLCKEHFPSGYYTNTQGLSIKYGKKSKELAVFMDSAGVGGALYFYNKEEMEKYLNEKSEKVSKKNFEKIKEKMLTDRILTEYFIQNFILYSCNIIIIVIELMTQQDQKMIERIKQFYLEKKRIVIIHNFFKLENKDQVLARAALEIEGAFSSISKQIIPESENIPYFIEKPHDKRLNCVVHLILGKEKFQSGEFFNEATFCYLMKFIETENSIEKFNIFDKINDYWVEKNQLYLTNFTQSLDLPKFILSKKNIEEKERNYKRIFRLDINKDVKLQLKSPEFNALGALKENDVKYHLYIKSKPIREKIYYFELPGCIEQPILTMTKRKSLNDNQILSLKIKNSTNMNPEFKCVLGGLPYNETIKKIKINDDKGDYKLDNSSIKFEGGMLQMKFQLKDENF